MNKLIIANWKMNPSTLAEAYALFGSVKKVALLARNTSTVIAPPHVFLQPLASSTRAKRLQFAAQNIHFAKSGSQVGEVSASQVKDVGASMVLIGHSARRRSGETEEDINKKIETALEEKLIPVVFVGERERDAHGTFLRTLRKQITIALEGIKINKVKNIVFVYEPVWAISTNKTNGDGQEITANDIHKMVLFLQKTIAELYGLPIARKVRVLYGGSVNAQNISSVLSVPRIDGAVVGAASLDAAEFRAILQVANKTR